MTITPGGCYNGAQAGDPINKKDSTSVAWEASVIANRTQVNASKGLNAPVIYQGGILVE